MKSSIRRAALILIIALATATLAQDKAPPAHDELDRALRLFLEAKLDDAEKTAGAVVARSGLAQDERVRAEAIAARFLAARAGAATDAKRKELFDKARDQVWKLAKEATSAEDELAARLAEVDLHVLRARQSPPDLAATAWQEAERFFDTERAARRETLKAVVEEAGPDAGAEAQAKRRACERACLVAEAGRLRVRLQRPVAGADAAAKKVVDARALELDAFFLETGRTLLGAELLGDLAQAYERAGSTPDAIACWRLALAIERAQGKRSGPSAADFVARAMVGLAPLLLAQKDTTGVLELLDRPAPLDRKFLDRRAGQALAIDRALARGIPPSAAKPLKAAAQKLLDEAAARDATAVAAKARLALLNGEAAAALPAFPGADGVFLGAGRREKGPLLTDVLFPPGLGPRLARRHAVTVAGGSVATESAVEAGLKWLARHQNDVGRWGADDFDQLCAKRGDCTADFDRGLAEHDVGVTGLALLAFLGGGHAPGAKDAVASDPSRPFALAVGRGLDWLIEKQADKKGGFIGGGFAEKMYDDALATWALAEAFAMTGVPSFGRAALRGTTFLIEAQNPHLGWRYTARPGDNDTSVTGFCLLALRAAQHAGLDVPARTHEGTYAWLNRVTMDSGQAGYNSPGSGEVIYERRAPGAKAGVPLNDQFAHHAGSMTAIALLGTLEIKKTVATPFAKCWKILADDLPKWDEKDRYLPMDFVYWFQGSLALYRLEGPAGATWKRWQRAQADALCMHQRLKKDGCLDGSWDARRADRWGWAGGRVYTTALGCLILLTPGRAAGADYRE